MQTMGDDCYSARKSSCTRPVGNNGDERIIWVRVSPGKCTETQ